MRTAWGDDVIPTANVLPPPERQPSVLWDALLGSVVLVALPVPGTGGAVTVGNLALAGLLALASLRRPGPQARRLVPVVVAVVALLGYLAVVSLAGADESLSGWERRWLRLGAVLAAVLALAGGRLHLPSVVRGAAAGLVVNALAFYGGVAPARYGDYLSGFLLDKNVTGFACAVVGVLAMGLAPSQLWRATLVAGFGAMVWATGSRTAIAAFAIGVVWFYARPRLGVLPRLTLAAAAWAGLRFVAKDYAQVGEFASRAGSDWFRARIDALSQAKLDAAPARGLGLGEAYVTMDGATWFFHNSYLTLLVEGGWVFLGAMLILHVWFGIRPFAPGRPPSAFAAAGEAANIVVLVCAQRLGEVFGTTPAALALAAGLSGYLAVRGRPPKRAQQ